MGDRKPCVITNHDVVDDSVRGMEAWIAQVGINMMRKHHYQEAMIEGCK